MGCFKGKMYFHVEWDECSNETQEYFRGYKINPKRHITSSDFYSFSRVYYPSYDFYTDKVKDMLQYLNLTVFIDNRHHIFFENMNKDIKKAVHSTLLTSKLGVNMLPLPRIFLPPSS